MIRTPCSSRRKRRISPLGKATERTGTHTAHGAQALPARPQSPSPPSVTRGPPQPIATRGWRHLATCSPLVTAETGRQGRGSVGEDRGTVGLVGPSGIPPSSRSRLHTHEPAGPRAPFGDLILTALPALQNTTHSTTRNSELRPQRPAAPRDPPRVTGRPGRRPARRCEAQPVSPPAAGVGALGHQPGVSSEGTAAEPWQTVPEATTAGEGLFLPRAASCRSKRSNVGK